MFRWLTDKIMEDLNHRKAKIGKRLGNVTSNPVNKEKGHFKAWLPTKNTWSHVTASEMNKKGLLDLLWQNNAIKSSTQIVKEKSVG